MSEHLDGCREGVQRCVEGSERLWEDAFGDEKDAGRYSGK